MNTGSKVYLALGDSMSIDLYTGVEGGGAVAQFHNRLGSEWALNDRSMNMCTIGQVPVSETGADLVTLTIGGNDLLSKQGTFLRDGLGAFQKAHSKLLQQLRTSSPRALMLVGNVYAPQRPLHPRLLSMLDAANSTIETNCKAVDACLIDIRAAFKGREQELLCSNIEPTFAGATVIAQRFEFAFRDYIEAL